MTLTKAIKASNTTKESHGQDVVDLASAANEETNNIDAENQGESESPRVRAETDSDQNEIGEEIASDWSPTTPHASSKNSSPFLNWEVKNSVRDRIKQKERASLFD